MIGEAAGPTFQCGGVCGWGNGNLKIQNVLITSQYENITKGVNGHVVSRNGFNASNVFYIQRSNPGFDTAGTLVTDEQLASGEICYRLNGDQSAINWWQTLGEDEHPMLFGTSKQVFYNEVLGYYYNQAEGDLNGDGKVDIADAVTVLNIMAAGTYVKEADVNNDQKIDIADFVTILNIMAAQ